MANVNQVEPDLDRIRELYEAVGGFKRLVDTTLAATSGRQHAWNVAQQFQEQNVELRARNERLRRAVLAAERYESGDVDIRNPAGEVRAAIALCREHGDLDPQETEHADPR